MSDSFECNDILYQIIGNQRVSVLQCNSKERTLILPKEVDYQGKKYQITQIKDRSFKSTKVKRVVFMKDSVLEEVCDFAFDQSLVNFVALPPTYRIFNDFSFANKKCTNGNVKILFPEENKYVVRLDDGNTYRKYPFELLMARSKKGVLVIRETVTKIFPNVYAEQEGIKSVLFPSTLKEIGFHAFYRCLYITHLTFPNFASLETIGEWSFMMTSVKVVNFPRSLKFIKSCAFFQCKSLYRISFPIKSELLKIGSSAFRETAIKNLILPASLEEIENNAFQACEYLENIVIQDDSKLVMVSPRAFAGCDNIKLITCNQRLVSKFKMI